MMRVFYASPAILHNSSEKVLCRDIDACLCESSLLDGYVFTEEGAIAGYAMTAKSFSTEYGGTCVWIEDLYVKPEYRRKGISRAFFSSLPSLYPDCVRFKLEVEPENTRAIQVYHECGYSRLPYDIMELVMIED